MYVYPNYYKNIPELYKQISPHKYKQLFVW